jgi:hypothetical protein
MSSTTKLPLQSKKFLALLITLAGWKLLEFWVLFEFGKELTHYGFLLMTTLIVVEGFLAVGYILGQAAIDKYTDLATTITDRDASAAAHRVKALEDEIRRLRSQK